MGSVLSVVLFSSIARLLLLAFCLWNHNASAQNPSEGVLHDSDALSSTRGLIGLVVLPQLYGSGSPRCLSHDVPLYRSATSALPFGKLYLAERPKDFQWPTIRMAVDDHADELENPTLEFAYEERGAIASARKNGRARIALHEGTAWITLRGCHAFLDVPTILKGKPLEYEVGARALAVTTPRGQRAASTTAWPAAELIDAASVGGALWLHFKPAATACSDSGDVAHGEEKIWLPFLDADRFPTVWFHSRGVLKRVQHRNPSPSHRMAHNPCMQPLPLRTQAFGFVGWLAISLLAGATGAIASVRAATFYAQLTQPTWAPPAWLFGPVWSVLYVLMAIAAWLIWRTDCGRAVAIALRLFVAQLVANALWTWLFFVWHQGAWALVEIVVLWALIAATLIAFGRIHRIAALLLLPYLAWVSFATALTWSLWRLNPAALG